MGMLNVTTDSVTTRLSRPHWRQAGALAVAGLVILGGIVASAYLAETESCLIGRWRVQESTGFPKAGILELRPDGTAQLTEFQQSPYLAIWKSKGIELEVRLVNRQRPDLEEDVEPGPAWRLQWKIIETTPEVLRLEGPFTGNRPAGQVRFIRD